jgi:hypothetical protein
MSKKKMAQIQRDREEYRTVQPAILVLLYEHPRKKEPGTGRIRGLEAGGHGTGMLAAGNVTEQKSKIPTAAVGAGQVETPEGFSSKSWLCAFC